MAALEKIAKSSTATLEKITKNISHLLYFRILESSGTVIRITEDGEKRLLEDSPSNIGINISKNTATLEKILKS